MSSRQTAMIVISLVLILASQLAFGAGRAVSMALVTDGKPNCAIVIGSRATKTERHAANELQSYIQKMTGARLVTKTIEKPGSLPSFGNIVLIGRPETNPLIARLTGWGLLKLSADSPGLDGFLIKQVRLRNRNCLILGGSSDIGTLYVGRFLGSRA